MSIYLGFDKKRADLFHCQWMMSFGLFSQSAADVLHVCAERLSRCGGITNRTGLPQPADAAIRHKLWSVHTHIHTHSRARARTHTHTHVHALTPPTHPPTHTHTLFLSLSRPDKTAMVDWALKPIFSFLPTFSLFFSSLPPSPAPLSFEFGYLVRSKSHAS